MSKNNSKPNKSTGQNQDKKNKNKKNNNKQGVNLSKQVKYSNPKTNKSQKFIVRKREFIANIPPSSTFVSYAYPLNPANTTSFPWLSTIATSFEKFIVHKLCYCFETSLATVTPGVICLAPEFNVNEPLPTSKAIMLEYQYARRGAVWESFKLEIPKSSIMSYKDYYINVGSSGTNDRRLSEPLYMVIGIDSVPPGTTSFIGELWVEYDIEFIIPQKLDPNAQQFYWISAYNIGPTTGNQTWVVDPIYGYAPVILNNNKQLIFRQSGTYMIQYCIYGGWHGSAIASDGLFQTATYTNCALLTGYYTFGSNQNYYIAPNVYQASSVVWIKTDELGIIQFDNNGWYVNLESQAAFMYIYFCSPTMPPFPGIEKKLEEKIDLNFSKDKLDLKRW